MDDRDPYPSLPPKDYRMSRMLRLLLFSLVLATLVVAMGIVLFQFAWNEFLAQPFGRAPYQVRVEFVLPAILLVAFVFARLIRDASEGRAPARKV